MWILSIVEYYESTALQFQATIISDFRAIHPYFFDLVHASLSRSTQYDIRSLLCHSHTDQIQKTSCTNSYSWQVRLKRRSPSCTLLWQPVDKSQNCKAAEDNKNTAPSPTTKLSRQQQIRELSRRTWNKLWNEGITTAAHLCRI